MFLIANRVKFGPTGCIVSEFGGLNLDRFCQDAYLYLNRAFVEGNKTR